MRGLSVSYLKAPRHLFYLLYIILTVYFFIQIVFVMFKMLLVSPYLRSEFHEIWIQASLHGSFVKPLVCVHTILSNSIHLFSIDLHIIYWNILIWSMFFYLQIALYFYPYRNQVMYKFLFAVHKMIIVFMKLI